MNLHFERLSEKSLITGLIDYIYHFSTKEVSDNVDHYLKFEITLVVFSIKFNNWYKLIEILDNYIPSRSHVLCNIVGS